MMGSTCTSRSDGDPRSRLAPELAQWIDAYRQTYGRAPRVLHIGNIANNAYNNARILHQVGIDCDVICYDYYHVMGCPEWEDADFEGDIRDDFYPAWERVALRGFQRPEWFAQGPMHLCWKYLIARRSGDVQATLESRRRLDRGRWWSCVLGRNPLLRKLRTSLSGTRRRLRWAATLPGRCRTWLAARRDACRAWLRESRRAWEPTLGASTPVIALGLKILALLLLVVIRLPFLPFEMVGFALRALVSMAHKAHAQPQPLALAGPEFDRVVQRLVQRFATAFPERRDQLTPADVEPYRSVIVGWSALFKQYDLIVGYSTDPILPMLAGVSYFALEHGTLRDIPFQDNPTARLTALAYHLAKHVFVTNSDCYEKGRQLAGDRVTFLNHPLDDDHYLLAQAIGEQRGQLQRELDAEHFIFFPTRHDWVPGTGYADKGNDKLLRAFARLVADGVRVGLVCCDWGKNVAQSRELLRQLKVDRHVKWIKPLGTVAFERMALSCGLVADQFHFGIYGGIMLKAMAAGVPVVTYVDERDVLARFHSIPPVLNAPTTDAIYAHLSAALARPEQLIELGRESRAWIKRYYSTQETIHKQLLVLREQLSLPGRRAAA